MRRRAEPRHDGRAKVEADAKVQPIPRHAYDDTTLNNYELVPNLTQLTPEDWDDYYDTVVRPHVQDVRPRGQYAAAARKRRAAEEGGRREV